MFLTIFKQNVYQEPIFFMTPNMDRSKIFANLWSMLHLMRDANLKLPGFYEEWRNVLLKREFQFTSLSKFQRLRTHILNFYYFHHSSLIKRSKWKQFQRISKFRNLIAWSWWQNFKFGSKNVSKVRHSIHTNHVKASLARRLTESSS